MTAEAFAEALAHTLEKRTCMLKLMSMNLYDLEANSRLENLAAFKREYAATLAALQHCLEVFFPAMTGDDRQAFLYAFFPFLFGVYPYTTATEKQKQAMGLAHIHYPRYSIYTITKSLVAKLLQPFQ